MKAIGVMTLARVLNSLASIVNAILIATYFGAERRVEVFFAASAVYVATMKMAQLGQLNEVFLPVYHRIKVERGLRECHLAFAVLLNWTLLVIGGLTALTFTFADPLMRIRVGGFTTADIELGVLVFRWIIPLSFVTTITSMLKGLANAEKMFGWPEAIELISNVAKSSVIILFVHSLGVWSIVLSFWLGNLVTLLGNAIVVHVAGYRHQFSLAAKGFTLRSITQDMSFTLCHVIAGVIYGFFLDNSLSQLPQGTFAVFRYVQSYYSELNGILLVPISTVFFTHFSEFAAKRTDGLHALLENGSKLNLAVCSLAIAASSVATYPVLVGLLGAQKFSESQLRLGTHLFIVLTTALLFTGQAQLRRKMVISLGLVRAQYLTSSLFLLMSSIATYFLIHNFSTRGAIASIWLNNYLLSLAPALLLIRYHSHLKVRFTRDLIARWVLASGAGWLMGTAINAMVGSSPFGNGRIGSISWGMALATVTVSISLTSAYFAGIHEVRELGRISTLVITRFCNQLVSRPDSK